MLFQGLFRNFENGLFIKVFTLVANITGVALSEEDAGRLLVDVTTSPKFADGKGAYFSNTITGYRQKDMVTAEGSKEANSAELQTKLWDLSEKLIAAAL